MTLIEVLAALLLMGSILVALVTARGRLVSQHAEAVDIQAAVVVADGLLAGWWATDPPSVPVGGRGEVTSHPGWVWTTREVGGGPEGLGVAVVRLSVLDERDTTRSSPNVLTQVDVLVPQGPGMDVPPPPATNTNTEPDRRAEAVVR